MLRRISEVVPITLAGSALLGIGFLALELYVVKQSDFFIRAVVSIVILVIAFLFVVTVVVRMCVTYKLKALEFDVETPNVTRDSTILLVNLDGGFKVWPMVLRIMSCGHRKRPINCVTATMRAYRISQGAGLSTCHDRPSFLGRLTTPFQLNRTGFHLF